MEPTKVINRNLYDDLFRIAELYKDAIMMDANHEYGEVDQLLDKVFNNGIGECGG